MNKLSILRLFMFFFILIVPILSYAQELRIDLSRINREKQTKQTNGEYMDYLENEVQKIVHSYGKASKEYITLKEYYLGEYSRIYEPYSTLDPISLKELSNGWQELLQCNEEVYGDSSLKYSSAIISYLMNFANVNLSIDSSLFKGLISLNNNAIKNFYTNDTASVKYRFRNLAMLYSQKGDLYLKAGFSDSAIRYFDTVFDISQKYHIYDNYIISLLGRYSNIISNKDSKKALAFLLEYEPIIRDNHHTNSFAYYNFLKILLSDLLLNNIIDKQTIIFLSIADSLCYKSFGKISEEYLDFSLGYKLSLFKKMGWKSMVYQLLANLDLNYVGNNTSILTQNHRIYMTYNLEWYYYYQSLNEENQAIKWLKWAELNDSGDSSLNRHTLTNKLIVYSELAQYYRYKNIDTCLIYNYKILDLEISAKRKWGDYVVHQYDAMAKLLISFNDSTLAAKAFGFCSLALTEFDKAYGKESIYYMGAQFTLGRIAFIVSKGELGLNYMWPFVYSQLNSKTFIPPLNISVFSSYGDILIQANMPDSADYFYNQIYLRNEAAAYFRILGTTQDMQSKALNDLSIQNYFILTQHLSRFNAQGYKYVSKELAENLFKKNTIYQIQEYINEAIENAKVTNEEIMLNRIEHNKSLYDSLLYSSSNNTLLIDSVYKEFDFARNLILQSYVLNHVSDTTKLYNLKKEYSYTDIQKSLHNEECFVDIVRFLKSDKELGFSPTPCYAIIIVDNKLTEKLEYTFIENNQNLESIIQQDGNNSDKISAILSPLLAKLSQYKKIYICPDGAFNLLNFYSLKDENDDFLINTKTILYVDTPYEFIHSNNILSTNRSISFFGNPDFSSPGSQNIHSQRNSIFQNFTFSNLKELPYSKLEIDASSDVLKNKGWKVLKFTEKDCSEANFNKQLAPGILHIATHGYYISDNNATSVPYAIQNNPYLRSGLIFGNVLHNKSLNDNVLTAYEVMNFDLKKTSLVVLSACESAKGELKPGQGVYGLQRAFKIAGAKNVLVSIKNVDDKATQLLMEYFYTYVAEGEDYPVALKKAQIKMIKHPLFNDPKYWAEFILVGK